MDGRDEESGSEQREIADEPMSVQVVPEILLLPMDELDEYAHGDDGALTREDGAVVETDSRDPHSLDRRLLELPLDVNEAEDEQPKEKRTCTPQCEGLHCGPDGCGGSCGFCEDFQHCTPDVRSIHFFTVASTSTAHLTIA